MKTPVEILNDKIETDKEILSVMPKNTKKNTDIYLKRANEIKEEYQRYLDNNILEIKRRVNRINSIEINPEIEKAENNVKVLETVDLFGDSNTSYEKMKLDEIIFVLRRFYKNNLEQVNNDIQECVKKFEEIGINLAPSDFNYSPFVREYMDKFFIAYEQNDVNSSIMKNTFEKIYWECPDIIIHIELNIRYLYLKNQKEIDKYFSNQNKELFKRIKITDKDFLGTFEELRKEVIDLKEKDKKIWFDKFVNKELDLKNYSKENIQKQYDRLLVKQYDEYSAEEHKEIKENIFKLSKSLYEYKNYLNYKYIIDKVIKIYNEKEKYKDIYGKQLKEIQKLEAKLFKTNQKYKTVEKKKDKILYRRKSREQLKQLTSDINSQVLEIKKLYRQMDSDKAKDKIASTLTDNSSLYDAIFIAAAYYTFLVETIIEEFEDVTDEEISEAIVKIRDFITNPYLIILKNISIKEDKDIALMIKDKYNLNNINITKDELNEDDVDMLIENVSCVVNSCNIEKSELNLDDIQYFIKANKILEDIKMENNS